MESFYKKSTLIRTICFMAFFVAINVILSFVAVYAPLVSIILIIFLPLTSAVVEINCKDRWFPIYALATIGLSIVVSLSQIDFTLFYVVPSIISGYIFGLFQKKNLPDMFSIFFAAIFQTGFSLAFIPLFNLISGTNFVEIFAKILKISDKNTFISWLACILFLMSLVQTILSFIVVKNELQKMGAKTDKKRDDYLFGIIAFIVSVINLESFKFSYGRNCCANLPYIKIMKPTRNKFYCFDCGRSKMLFKSLSAAMSAGLGSSMRRRPPECFGI